MSPQYWILKGDQEGIYHIFFLFYCFIHMCIQGLGHFSPLPPPPPLPPTPPPPSPPPPPQYPVETTLPLSLILLKIEYRK
jgi:hypothetical protein